MRIIITLFMVPVLVGLNLLEIRDGGSFEYNYGVFLAVNPDNIERMADYRTVVIDAQYYSAEDIATLHSQGHIVYSYLNIGSLEEFRDYFSDYEDLTLGEYENWEDERWIDVSEKRWQNKIASLAEELSIKGVDGYFVDNCDVYYVHESDGIYEGITAILQDLMAHNKEVIINGGDYYVTRYRSEHGTADNVMTGVNQESVFSRIDWNRGIFGTAETVNRQYFEEYILACANDGMDVYLLEYTVDNDLIYEIMNYCDEKGFDYYISDSIELD